jgi:exonuclease III
VFHSPRMGRTGGGVAVLARDTIGVTTFDSPDTAPKSFEHMALSLTINFVCIRLIVVYRPPKSKPSVSFQCFMKEFSTYLEFLSVSSGKVIIVGDFNLHVDNPDDSNARRFAALLKSLSWIQHVKGATHID